MNELVIELERKAAGMTDETPYCVLSREMMQRILAALDAPLPVEDPWLVAMQQALTPIEFRVYHTLYRARGRTVDTPTLLLAARVNGAASLWVHIRRLRVKVEQRGWPEIKTVRGDGYYLSLPGRE